jgi:hypothetical protein
MVCPLQSKAETHERLRCRAAHLKLRARFLNERRLLFQSRRQPVAVLKSPDLLL